MGERRTVTGDKVQGILLCPGILKVPRRSLGVLLAPSNEVEILGGGAVGREKKYDAYLGISGLETQDRAVREGGEKIEGG